MAAFRWGKPPPSPPQANLSTRHQSRHPLTFDSSSPVAAAASASPPFRSWPTALQLTNPLSLLAESLLSTNERQERKKIDKWLPQISAQLPLLTSVRRLPYPKKGCPIWGYCCRGTNRLREGRFREVSLPKFAIQSKKYRFWQNFNLKNFSFPTKVTFCLLLSAFQLALLMICSI